MAENNDTDLVELLARALMQEFKTLPWDKTTDIVKSIYRNRAERVLAALRVSHVVVPRDTLERAFNESKECNRAEMRASLWQSEAEHLQEMVIAAYRQAGRDDMVKHYLDKIDKSARFERMIAERYQDSEITTALSALLDPPLSEGADK